MQTELGALELVDGNLQSRAALAREFDHGFGSPPARRTNRKNIRCGKILSPSSILVTS